MPYDERLAERIRDLLAAEPDLTEKKMFGGLAFLLAGHLAVAASSQGGLLVRVDRDEAEALVARGPARPMEMKGRPMTGWLRVDAEHLGRRAQLAKWVDRGVAAARSQPPKAKSSSAGRRPGPAR